MVLLLSQPLLIPGLLGEGRVGVESRTTGRIAEEESNSALVPGVFPMCYLLCKVIPIYRAPRYTRNAVRYFKCHITFVPPQAWSIVPCVCVCDQLCPTLCNQMACSPPDSSVHGIFPARILGQVAIFFFKGSSWPRD